VVDPKQKLDVWARALMLHMGDDSGLQGWRGELELIVEYVWQD
jgi:hypothetical protein